MRKKPNSVHKMLNLDKDVVELIRQGATLNALNQSEFVEFLVKNWGINPGQRAKNIKTELKVLKSQVYEKEKEEKLVNKNIEKLENWNKTKQQNKPTIIKNLVRIIKEGRYKDAELITKNQSIALGIPASQLLIEAMQKANPKNEGEK